MIKKIFIILGVLIALVLGAIIVLPIVFKDNIVQAVKDAANDNLNATLNFGDFDLSLIRSFPDFSVEINDLSVANKEPFEGDTLISMKSLHLTVDLMSVISGNEMKIKTVRLDQPRMNFSVLEDGRANWDIAKSSATGETSAPETSPEKEEAPSEGAPFKAALKSLEIVKGYMAYEDKSLAFAMVLNELDFELSGDFTADFTSVKSKGSIHAVDMSYEGVPYLTKAVVGLKADLDADMNKFEFTFKENELKVNELELGLDGKFAMPDNGYVMDLKFAAKKNEFKNFLSMVPAVYANDFASVKTSGKLALDGYVKGLYNDSIMPGFGTNIVIEDAMFKYPDLPGAMQNIQVAVNIDSPTGDPDQTVVDISKFHVEMMGNPFDMHMRIATPVSDPQVDGAMKGVINLSKLGDIVPREKDDKLSGIITADLELKGRQSSIDQGRYEDFHAVGGLGIADMYYQTKDFPQGMRINKLQFNFSPQYLDLAEFNSMIGKSDLQASGKVTNYLAYALKDSATLAGNFRMTSTSFDLNEFMTEDEAAAASTPASGEGTPASGEAAPPAEEALSVIEVPPFIDFVASASFGKLLYDNMPMDNVSGSLKIKDQVITLENFKMNTLGGAMTVNGTYGTKDVKSPDVDFSLDIKGFDVEQTTSTFNTVAEIAPIAKACKGSYSTSMSFVTKLDDKMEPVMNTLAGQGRLKAENIKVEGFQPLEKMADVLRNPKLKKWEFNNMDVAFRFSEGRVHVDPVPLKLGNVKGTMQGSNGFDQTLDYVLNLQIPRSDMGGDAVNGLLASAGLKNDPNATLPVDVMIGGTVTNPTITPSIKGATTQVKDQVKEVVKEKVEELKDKGREELQKQADKVRAEGKAAAQRIRDEAEANAKKIEDEGKGNPLKKKAAQVAADKVRKEGEAKAKQVEDEANRKADGIENTAKQKADDLLNK
ncbi:MAG: AsmA family protein [Flavobacteriales bacterium]|nr:AsmA family protein [Flavobacteriales bacterium]MCB9447625.1 AsmA family protein [Flavobacteriales bacterium]